MEEEWLERGGVRAEKQELVGLKSCALVVTLEGNDNSRVEDLIQRSVKREIQPLSFGTLEEKGLCGGVYA